MARSNGFLWQLQPRSLHNPVWHLLIPQQKQADESGQMNYTGRLLEYVIWAIVSLKSLL